MLERVWLVEPQNGYYAGFQGLVQTEPLGLEFLAGAITPLVRDVRIHDDRAAADGWRDGLRAYPPDLVGVRCNYTADVPVVRRLIENLREELGPGVPIVAGGHHVSLRPSDLFMPEVDAIVAGAGEEPMRDLVAAWAAHRSFEGVAGVWYRQGAEFVSNVVPARVRPVTRFDSPLMNERPLPRRDLVEEFRDSYYFLYYPQAFSVEMARGCRFRCSFCSVWNFHGGEYHVQSASRTVEELASLPANARYINIVDDLAFADVDAAEHIARELLRLGMGRRYFAQVRADTICPKDAGKRKRHQAVFELLARAGLDMVLIGLESFEPSELKRINKGTSAFQNVEAIRFMRSLGVKIWGAQIVFPHWSREDFDRAIELNQRLGIECPQFTVLTPLPGTPDYDAAKREGILLTDDPRRFDFFHWVVPTRLPPEETYRQIARLYRETAILGKRGEDGRRGGAQMRGASMLKDDLRSGLTNRPAIEAFKARFELLCDEQQHLAHLARSALAVIGEA
jgi:radical SAM superfamily enzyme YgiQ (UPF0313 family)